jgi:outer membrane protein assembly factor BamB
MHCAAHAQQPDEVVAGLNDWPWWRGPNRNGIAAPQKPPLTWSEKKNVLWKIPIPGRGHGSPIVVGDQVFLATAEVDKELQSLLAFDRRTGQQLWQTEIHRGKFVTKGINGKSSHASATAACDGERVFITFPNDNGIHASALDRQGKILWQKKVAGYTLHQGYGPSPMIYRTLVLVSADNKGTGAIAGLERATGKIVWKQERPKLPNYASPIVLNLKGRDQLILTGCGLLTSFDPMTGTKLWETPGTTEETVTSVVTDGEHIITSGGYPKKFVAAIKADGSGKTAWEIKTQVYVPSMLIRDGYLYAVTDTGVAYCWKCATGESMWEERLAGAFTASPVLVGDHIFATNESGKTFIYKASPAKFESIGHNQLGNEVLATPTYCGDRIYFRVAVQEKGRRQEYLYCIGK